MLVVEDSEADYELLRYLFRIPGFKLETHRVEDERGMREALNNEPWDVVVSDHNLPQFSSREAIGTLAASGVDIPLIILSGVIGEEAAVEAMLAGADDFVMKANPRRLIPAIERSLQAAEVRREQRRAAQAQHESEQRFLAISRNLPGAVLRLEFDPHRAALGVRFASEGAAALCGHEGPALAREPNLFLECIHAEDRVRLADRASRAAAEQTPLRWEGRLMPAQGKEPRWVLLAATPGAGGEGLSVWDGVAIDITPQKQVERELRESQEALRALTAHLERVKEAERAELARELHDEVGGLLTALKVNISTISKMGAPDARFAEKVDDSSELIEHVVRSVKDIARSLRPAILDHGLGAALEWQARDFEKRMSIPTRFTSNDENVTLDIGQSTGVFRVFQEALTNVAKHAEAKNVEVELFAQEDMVSLEIRDDGRGFSAVELDKADSFGVLGMRERVHRMGGWIDVSSKPGGGTTLMVSVPRDPPADGATPESP